MELIAAFVLAIPFTPVLIWFEKYGFIPELGPLVGLLGMVILDTITGMWASLKLKVGLSSQKMKGMGEKIFLYLLIAVSLSIVVHNTRVTDLASWLNAFVMTGLMMREFLSVTENVSKIRPSLVPAWVRKKLADFDDDGKLNGSVK